MGYHPRFAIWSIGGESDAETLRLARRALFHLCISLCRIDFDLLQSKSTKINGPAGIPPLYSAGVRYHDDSHLDCWKGTCRIQEDDWQDVQVCLAKKYADCFPVGTLLLRNDYRLVQVEDIRVGDKIWGRDNWTTVEAVVNKGLLTVDAMVLNNGSVVQLTGDHHVYVGRCPDHKQELDSGYGCSCPLSSRKIEKVRLRDLKKRDVLVTPDRIPFGTETLDPDRAYVEGLYVADGWSGEDSRFQISGQDGCPKEAQKREVKTICEKFGLSTYWHRKYIGVNDSDWAIRMHGMGQHAPEKHILSIAMNEAAATATLRGVMADSKVNPNGGWTFTTTSKKLATQVRVLHKMHGRSSSVMYIENHGGLGKNPIWRLGIRDPKKKKNKLLRVKRIEHDLTTVSCYDIQTSDHYVYLPEHDVTVSNCEDLACWRCAELWVQGINALPFPVLQNRGKDEAQLWHIQVLLPDGSIEDPSARLGMNSDIPEPST